MYTIHCEEWKKKQHNFSPTFAISLFISMQFEKVNPIREYKLKTNYKIEEYAIKKKFLIKKRFVIWEEVLLCRWTKPQK